MLISIVAGAPHGKAALAGPATAPVIGFTVFAAEPIEGLAYETQPEGRSVPLRFYPTARSPRHELRGRQPLRLVEVASGEVVAEVALPAAFREVLLLVERATTAAKERRYRVTVIDDGARERSAGQIQILNLSGLALTGELNARRFDLTPGLNPAVSVGRSARLLLRTTFRNRSYISWHDTIALAPTDRALVVLFPPLLPGSVEVQTRVLLDEPPLATAPAGR